MQQSSALNSVLAWQAAVNAQDLDGLLEHSAPDIAVAGPRGTGVGHQVLREWLARAGLTLTTTRAFVRGDTVGSRNAESGTRLIQAQSPATGRWQQCFS